jgi:hypothetical protein
VEWDSKYPTTRMIMLPKGVSDHNPLKVSFGEKASFKEPIFRFEKQWLKLDDFTNVVKKA